MGARGGAWRWEAGAGTGDRVRWPGMMQGARGRWAVRSASAGGGAVAGAVRGAGQGAQRRRRMAAAAELQELRELVERAGGRRAVLLVAEVAEGAPAAATLAAFARDLLGDEAPPVPGPVPGCRSRRRAGGGRRALAARLLLVLCRGGAARDRGARARLREVVRDVRSRLPPAPPPAVVGVLLPGGDGEDAAVLDATLRRHFPVSGTVQAARYSPGSPAALRDCRAAACRALRAALQHPAEEGKDRERWRLLSFLRCISWSRRSRREGHKAKDANNVHEDDLQDPEEEVALTSLSPNGNCEEAAGCMGT
ncbi:uncharacterized protein C2orf72 homolog [Numenius arquata]|uniref:uncharacterized protein C2orf72 homolog n=1 Tax=Numenius arquata TaxID=31919 RepID=UPI003D307D0E